ncbi:peroxidase [Marmoricola endophyticus]|uniref:Deferrochelatase n=1 Tax=Marmoricola endophyticus TaxID=2040280 RepID=A0A917F2E4_9ACTN|nr:iron uptake transporter deferrochelatase/peroxidase subunit [Marmoricola endophyticus]GGF41708.1 peroxidase [Marmoricola endophyticus]
MGLSRRRVLGATGAGALGLAGAGAGGWALGRTDDAPATADRGRFAFHGTHQAGIVTPAQDRLHFASFDVTATSREDLIGLLRTWTAAAAEMTRGAQVGGDAPEPYDAPPSDTGEALGLPPSGLTLTFGFGPTLFTKEGEDRFGLAERQPAGLQTLPHFPADALRPERSGGDLCVQACADDPQVAVHAIRNLSRLAFGTAVLRWSQLGFGRTSSTTRSQSTPRNLFGFKDGTANIKAEDTPEIDRFVWVRPEDDPDAEWLAGGSYLVARRINMRIEQWDSTSLSEQEAVVGRDRTAGAPLSGGTEHTDPDFSRRGSAGPLIPVDAHVRLAHPAQNRGVQLLRRGYNFTDGNDELGRLDAGLFFIAFVRDPVTGYVPMQNQLSKSDAMMEYLQHTGSALFAVPPGVQPGHYLGQSLFT